MHSGSQINAAEGATGVAARDCNNWASIFSKLRQMEDPSIGCPDEAHPYREGTTPMRFVVDEKG